MKKILIVIISVILIVLLCILIVNISLDSKVKDMGLKLETDLKGCYVEYEANTHGGFLGDGDSFMRINCEKKKAIDVSKWKELPMSLELETILEMKMCNEIDCLNAYERYNIPHVETGYYYFIDRHSEVVDIHDEEELSERSSYNFSIAIYDSNKKMIYYYELDT